MYKNTTNYHESRAIPEIINSIKEFYITNLPEVLSNLNPPAAEEHLDAFEKIISLPLPQDFRALYRLADGQRRNDIPFFPECYHFSSLEVILKNWKMLNDISKDFISKKVLHVFIKDVWWNTQWIPFAIDDRGDHYCIDLDPGLGGTTGQIIEFLHDDVDRRHIANSLTDFLGTIDNGLKNEKYFVCQECMAVWSISHYPCKHKK